MFLPSFIGISAPCLEMVWMISSAAWVALTGEVTQWVWPRLARAWAWASSRGDALIP